MNSSRTTAARTAAHDVISAMQRRRLKTILELPMRDEYDRFVSSLLEPPD